MTKETMTQQHHATFEEARQIDEAGNEFWSARDIAPLLEYQDWRNFMQVVDKARLACEQSGRPVTDHFGDATKMVSIGSGAQRPVPDVHLSRYACYLIVQNGDPSKPVIANGQTYFAIQTRRQELADDKKFAQLSEDEKRLAIRAELAAHNKYLAAAAKDAGVEPASITRFFRTMVTKGFMAASAPKSCTRAKASKRARKSSITWAARKWQPIYSALHKPKKNCAATTCTEKRKRIKRITRSEKKCGKPLKSWVAPCPKTCPSPMRAFSNWNRPRKS